MNPLDQQKFLEDVRSVLAQAKAARNGPPENPEAVPLSSLVAAVRNSGGPGAGWCKPPTSGRRWRLSTWFVNRELEEMLEKDDKVEVVKVYEKRNPNVRRMTLVSLKG